MNGKKEKQVLSLIRQYALLNQQQEEVSKLQRIVPKLSPEDFR
jgi:hypothetical protein